MSRHEKDCNTEPGGSESVTSSLALYHWLLSFSRPYWKMGVVAVVGMCVDAVGLTLFARLLQPMLDNTFTGKDPGAVLWMPVLVIGLFAARSLGSFASDFGSASVGRRAVRDIRNLVFRRYLFAAETFTHSESPGQRVSRITYTAEQVALTVTESLKVAVVDGLTVIGMAGVMIYYSPYLTASLFLLVPAVLAVGVAVGSYAKRASKRMQDNVGSINGAVEASISGSREIKIYGAQEQKAFAFDELSDFLTRLGLKLSAVGAASTSIIQILAAGSLSLIIFLATQSPAMEGMTAGIFFAVLSAMGAILPSVKRIASLIPGLQRGLVAARSLHDLVSEPCEENGGSFAPLNLCGDIEFRSVGFSYEKDGSSAINDVSLRCRPNTTTALVGRSGCGKTTLVSLLPRLYVPDSGGIFLDSRDVSDYDLAWLRRQISWVGQSAMLFEGTIEENIAFGELAASSPEDIRRAARLAFATPFIDKLPKGMKFRVGAGGMGLSGGQRQRIVIARAFLKNAPIVILDEATSSLDPESEYLVQSALNRLLAGRTGLVIAHRLKTVEHADQIAVMDDGRIVDVGRHADLMGKEGIYSTLFNRMSGTFAVA